MKNHILNSREANIRIAISQSTQMARAIIVRTNATLSREKKLYAAFGL